MKNLGDRTPSAFMDELLALMDDRATCFLFEAIFLNALPEQVRLHLEDADFADPRAVALKADALFKVQQASTSSTSFVNEISPVETQQEAVHAVQYGARVRARSHEGGLLLLDTPVSLYSGGYHFAATHHFTSSLHAAEPASLPGGRTTPQHGRDYRALILAGHLPQTRFL